MLAMLDFTIIVLATNQTQFMVFMFAEEMSPLVYVASASRKQVATSYSCVLTAPRPSYGTINACYASQLPRLLETQPYGYVYNNSRLETADVLANGFLQRFIESVGQSKSMFVRDCYNGTGKDMRYGIVQCTGDLSLDNCTKCLNGLLHHSKSCCQEKYLGFQILYPSC